MLEHRVDRPEAVTRSEPRAQVGSGEEVCALAITYSTSAIVSSTGVSYVIQAR
jgi:hypothetical protein